MYNTHRHTHTHTPHTLTKTISPEIHLAAELPFSLQVSLMNASFPWLHLLLSLNLDIPLVWMFHSTAASLGASFVSQWFSGPHLGGRISPSAYLGRREWQSAGASNSASEPALSTELPAPFTTASCSSFSQKMATQRCGCVIHPGPVTQSQMKIRSVNWRLRLTGS